MIRKHIRIFIEGEGGGGTPSKRHSRDGEFRKSWGKFLQAVKDAAANCGIHYFQLTACGSGSDAYNRFCNDPVQAGELRVLLIDSECDVQDVSKPWSSLQKRCPNWADDDNCYLMVQCLETWLIADIESVAKHYKNCFNNKKPAWPNCETIHRHKVQSVLELATKTCANPYSHAYGNFLIGLVNPKIVTKLSSAKRLFERLPIKIKEFAAE